MTNELHQAEKMQTTLNMALLMSCPISRVSAESRLFDLCLEAGMDFDEPDHIEWAAVRINDVMGSL